MIATISILDGRLKLDHLSRANMRYETAYTRYTRSLKLPKVRGQLPLRKPLQATQRSFVSIHGSAAASRFQQPQVQHCIAHYSGGQRIQRLSPAVFPSVPSRSSSTGTQFVPRPKTTTSSDNPRALLKPHNLFHPFSESPSPLIRKRYQHISENSYCPHPDHKPTRLPTSSHDPESRKHNATTPPCHNVFECPDCGIPTYCSEAHWLEDYEEHMKICDALREINEDDHDLVSGRFFPEFDYPGPQEEDFIVNMTNWDTFMYTREFIAINNDRSMRQVTRLLTYPMTIASIVHDLSPYNIRKGGRLTPEGLKSLSALRYTLHPPRSGESQDITGLRIKSPPARVFILGASTESSLPREVWLQLSHIFPRALVHLNFIGPESMVNRDSEFPLPERTPGNPFGGVIEDRLGGQMKITTYVDYFHTMYRANMFQPFDPYFDCFVLFQPGLGHPASSHEWAETVPMLLESKIPVICTGSSEHDIKRDMAWLMDKHGGETDLILEPGENIFRSLRWELNDTEPSSVSCGNWGVWAFRGERYETTFKD